MKLSELYENPKNPSKASEEQLERLAGKLKRVPLGLTAMRIAYVVDENGKKMVISGNKRLRVLKRAYGEDAELPDNYFQDVTAMSEAERHEFIVTANVSDGDWDIEALLEQYDTSELNDFIGNGLLEQILAQQEDNSQNSAGGQQTTPGDAFKERYIATPFSVIVSYRGDWKDRKKQWLNALPYAAASREGVLGTNNLFTETCGTVSIFDPVLAEVLAKWFCIPNGKIFDTFAGDIMKGLVFAKCGHSFKGIELRQSQVDENNEGIKQFKKDYPGQYDIEYICDDGQNVEKHFKDNTYDMLFSCPPYYDLEVYSNDKKDASNQATYEDFIKILENSYKKAIKVLKDNSFAVIVVGDIRNKKDGSYYDFPGDIKRIFMHNGCKLYNEIIFATPLGNACMRVNIMMKSRKTVKVHQNVLVFYKGDTRQISKKFPIIQFSDKEIEKFLENSGENT